MTEKIFTSLLQPALLEKGYEFAQGKNLHYLSKSLRGNEGDIKLIKNGTAIRDTSAFCTLEITGKDVIDFLNRISSNDLRNLQINSSIRTIFCSDKGRIIDSVLILNEGTRFLLFGSAGSSEKLSRWINKFIVNDDVSIKDITGILGSMEVYGPQSQSFLILLSGIKSEEFGKVYQFEFDDEIFHLIKYRYGEKLDRYIVYGESVSFEKLAQYILAYDGPFDIAFISEPAIQHFFIKKFVPTVNELSDLFNPHEVNMMNEVSLKKGSFIGQEVIARLDTYDKVQKFLVQFELKEDYTGELPIGLFDSEKGETGILTSVSTIRNDGKILGLGLVRKNILEKGRILRMGSQNSESFLSIKELK